MVYTFLSCYNQFDDDEYSLRLGYDFVLSEFKHAVMDKRVPMISAGKINFKVYKLNEYPDRDKLEMFVIKHWSNRHHELYFCGTKYESLSVLIDALGAADKMIIELTLEVDE